MSIMDIRKIVQHPEFINLITQTIFYEEEANTKFVSLEVLADETHFLLYKDENRAILVELQPCLNRVSFQRTITKCLNIQNDHHLEPLVVIVSTNNISESIMNIMHSYKDRFPWDYIDSNGWATNCIIISKDETSFLRKENPDYFDSFLVVATYFSDDENEKRHLRNQGDLTIQLLDNIVKYSTSIHIDSLQ